MEYIDSHDRFAKIQTLMQRYAQMGKKFTDTMNAAPTDEKAAQMTTVRALSVLDLMKAHLDTAIVEAEKLDDDMFHVVNATKEQAISELRNMLKALTIQIEYMDKGIKKLRGLKD